MDLFKSGTRRMLRDIESELCFTRGLIGKDALDARVMAVMARVPRERFVPGNMRPLAFRNGPLPIAKPSGIFSVCWERFRFLKKRNFSEWPVLTQSGLPGLTSRVTAVDSKRTFPVRRRTTAFSQKQTSGPLFANGRSRAETGCLPERSYCWRVFAG